MSFGKFNTEYILLRISFLRFLLNDGLNHVHFPRFFAIFPYSWVSLFAYLSLIWIWMLYILFLHSMCFMNICLLHGIWLSPLLYASFCDIVVQSSCVQCVYIHVLSINISIFRKLYLVIHTWHKSLYPNSFHVWCLVAFIPTYLFDYFSLI